MRTQHPSHRRMNWIECPMTSVCLHICEFHTLSVCSDSGKKYKWATTLDTQFTFNFKTAHSHQSINTVEWGDNIRGVQRSESGAEVSVFVPLSAACGDCVTDHNRDISGLGRVLRGHNRGCSRHQGQIACGNRVVYDIVIV